MPFTLNYSELFFKKAKKLLSKNIILKNKVKQTILLLTVNPYDPRLKSHKVTSVQGHVCYSSRVTGDIRILWRRGKDKAEILYILDLGGHSGSDKVYK